MILRIKEILFHNENPKQTISKNIFWLGAIQLSRVLRMITLVYAARVLGRESYGLFSYVISTLAILSLFSDIGIGEILTRNVASHKDKQFEYFATSFWMRVFLILVSVTIIFFAIPHIATIYRVKSLVYLAIILIIFDNLRELILSYLRGIEKMELEAMIFTTMNILMALFGFFILAWQPSTKALLMTYILSGGMGLLVSVVLSRKILSGVFHNFRKKLVLEILRDCWPLAIIGLFGMMFSLDIVMLGWWRSEGEIGLYSAGQKIIQILYTLPVILATAILPTLSALIKNNNPEEERSVKENSLTTIFMFTLPIIAFGLILSEQILQFVYGIGYVEGSTVFRILITSTMVVFPSIIISNVVIAYNQQKEVLKYLIVASLANIVLNIILIPKFGMAGAATATFIAQTINLYLTWNRVKKVRNFETIKYLKKITIGSAIMSLFCFGLREMGINLLLNVIVSFSIYITFLIIAKEKVIYEFLGMMMSIKNKNIEEVTNTIKNEI